jgi:hypothetical protein
VHFLTHMSAAVAGLLHAFQYGQRRLLGCHI